MMSMHGGDEGAMPLQQKSHSLNDSNAVTCYQALHVRSSSSIATANQPEPAWRMFITDSQTHL